jgi:hypothetical protein
VKSLHDFDVFDVFDVLYSSFDPDVFSGENRYRVKDKDFLIMFKKPVEVANVASPVLHDEKDAN